MTLTTLAFDLLMCFLLAAAAAMCWRVDQRFRALRAGQDGLTQTIQDLNDAVERSRASLAALDRAAKSQGVSLKTEVEEARKLADELRFLTDQGETLAQTVTRRRREPANPERLQPAQSVNLSADTNQRRRLDALKALR